MGHFRFPIVSLLLMTLIHYHDFVDASTPTNPGVCFQNEFICHAADNQYIYVCCPKDTICCSGKLSVACCQRWDCITDAGPDRGHAFCADWNKETGADDVEKVVLERKEMRGRDGGVVVVEGVAFLRRQKANGHGDEAGKEFEKGGPVVVGPRY